MDLYRPKYNVLTTAGNSFGYKHSIETINKLKEKLTKENHPKFGYITSAETKQAIRKGIKELTSGITCVDNFHLKGRWKAEEHLPTLLEDIKKLVDSQSQTDPSFKSQRLYTRLTASEVRKLLIEKFGYNDEHLPTEETIRVKLNYLGYRLKRVAKVLPQKKFQKIMQSSSN